MDSRRDDNILGRAISSMESILLSSLELFKIKLLEIRISDQ